jgi:hypothetical protein
MFVQEGNSVDQVFRPELIAMLDSGVKSDTLKHHLAKETAAQQDIDDLS